MIPLAKTKTRLLPVIALTCAVALNATGAGFASATADTRTAPAQEDWRCQEVHENDKPVTVCTFNYTGDRAWWTVPAGVNSVDIELWGAQGAAGGDSLDTWPGGAGGYTHATLAATPLTRYQVTVGGKGGDAGGNSWNSYGGYNGGGNGNTYAGGGGGATDVRINGFQITDRVLVAGGGGATGYGSSRVRGGDGSGKDGDKASPWWDGGGYGATWYQPGAGGKGSPGGQDGDFGQGGYGSHFGGGGGGGGWYGGGGGANYSGGGGGSGFVDQRVAQIVSLETGTRQGDGLAIIRYATPAFL